MYACSFSYRSKFIISICRFNKDVENLVELCPAYHNFFMIKPYLKRLLVCQIIFLKYYFFLNSDTI